MPTRSTEERARGLDSASLLVGRIRITSQNHGCALKPAGIGEPRIEISVRMKALFEKALDNAVFKRMEADDGQSTGRRQKSPSTFQSGLEFIELVVDLNTHRLERTRRRMLSSIAAILRHCRFYELCKRSGCSDWRTRSCFNNCPCNAVCEALFTEIRKHLGNFLNRCSGKPLRCGFAAARVHAHIEGPLEAEGKTAGGIVNLRRRYADVEKDPIDLSNTEISQTFFHSGKRRMDNLKARIFNGSCRRHRLWIAIESNQPPLLRKPLKNEFDYGRRGQKCRPRRVHLDEQPRLQVLRGSEREDGRRRTWLVSFFCCQAAPLRTTRQGSTVRASQNFGNIFFGRKRVQNVKSRSSTVCATACASAAVRRARSQSSK